MKFRIWPHNNSRTTSSGCRLPAYTGCDKGQPWQRVSPNTSADKKYIANIERTHGLKGVQRHRDDATSVRIWVEEMKSPAIVQCILDYLNLDYLNTGLVLLRMRSSHVTCIVHSNYAMQHDRTQRKNATRLLALHPRIKESVCSQYALAPHIVSWVLV